MVVVVVVMQVPLFTALPRGGVFLWDHVCSILSEACLLSSPARRRSPQLPGGGLQLMCICKDIGWGMSR